MTGFGKASTVFANKKITAEIRSLNSKQFDLAVKLPSLYREKELLLRNQLAEKLGRGKVDLSIYAETAEGEKRVTINQSLALSYLAEIKTLASAGSLHSDNDFLSVLLGMPDVLQSERAELNEGEWHAVETLVLEAADALKAFREDEGERLAKDIGERIRLIESFRKEVETYLDERIANVRERIQKNVQDLIAENKIDNNRLEQEIVYYLEKLDITEEHIRLAGHCTYFLETMESPDFPGKKLGFISQEIGREINTMGAKANHVAIQKLVVQMKDELEKIKEQLLNIR
jgi:uncharacterized protein (TIGR00255 family)